MTIVAKVIISAVLLSAGCDTQPQTSVIVDNDYPPSTTSPLVVYRTYWQASSFQDAIMPGASSDAQSTVPASDNTAYAILAPGWDLTTQPTSFVVLQSRSRFAVHLGEVLHIPVDDTTFVGNCASGSLLLQAQADFITQRVFTQDIFPDAFPPFRYEAATCTTTLIGDAGGP